MRLLLTILPLVVLTAPLFISAWLLRREVREKERHESHKTPHEAG